MTRKVILMVLVLALAAIFWQRFHSSDIESDAPISKKSKSIVSPFMPRANGDYGVPTTTQDTLFRLLRAKEFVTLDQQFEQYATKYDNAEIPETSFDSLVDTFAVIDPSLEPLLLEWIKSTNSWSSKAAAARYFNELSWQWRGNAFWGKVPEQNKLKFREYQKLAESLATESKQNNKRDSIWYANEISIANQGGDTNELELIKEGLSQFPKSILIYHSAIHAQGKKWGGDEYYRQQLIHEYSSLLDKTQHDGGATIHRYRATDAASDKDYVEAIRSMTTALEYNSDRINYYYRLASYYYKTDQFDKALGMVDVAVEYWPYHGGARLLRANIYLKLRQAEKAKVDIDQLLEREPLHKEGNLQASAIYARLGQQQEAMSRLERSTYFTQFNANEWVRQGFHLEHELNNPEAAKSYYYKSIELSPLNSGAHYKLATQYGHQESCKLVEHLYKYLQGCAVGEGSVRHWCSVKYKTWAYSSVNYLKDHRKCPAVDDYDFSGL